MKGIIMDYHVYIIIGLLMAVDIISGLIKGFLVDGFDSTKMRNGIGHKMTYIIALSLAALIEYGSIYLDFGYTISALQPAVAVYISLTEVGSVLENIVAVNPDLADKKFMAIFDKRNGKDA